MSQYELPDEITLTLDEARQVTLALYDARDALVGNARLEAHIASVISMVSRKLVPDLPE